MGEVLSTGNRESPVVTLVEGEDDRIVLIEQMWKYKKDLTRFLLLKHGFVVTTTASGKKTKRDIVFNSLQEEGSTRIVQYKHHEGDRVYSRIKLDPTYTETQLQSILEDKHKHYDPLKNNCWHYSHEVVQTLEGNTQRHPYILFLRLLHRPLLS